MTPVQGFTVAFALSSKGREEYAARTRVAIASIRLSNPRVSVVVACDRNSYDSLHETNDPLLREADRWITVNAPAGNTPFVSRFVKTTLRSHIEGPFLYLDSDVLVRGSLDEVFLPDCDIAGAPNHSRDALGEQLWDQDQALLRRMGWEIGADVYINSGVVLWNDTQGARRFAEEWHRRWVLSSSSQDSIRDQPAFNSALMVTRPRLAVLPHRFNAQVFTSPQVADGATIWHFYATDRNRIPERYTALVRDALSDSPVNPDDIARMVAAGDPWTTGDLKDRSIALTDQLFALLSALAAGRSHALVQQEELNRTSAELRATHQELRRTQDELRATRQELRRTQDELRDLHAALLAATDSLINLQASEHYTRLALGAAQASEDPMHAESMVARQAVLSSLVELARSRSLLAQVLASKSWRLTKPLRAVDELMRRVGRHDDVAAPPPSRKS